MGKNVILNSLWKRNTLDSNSVITLRTLAEGAIISIGDDTGISSSTISAQKSIAIGSRVLIGSGCLITDTDHHPVDVAPKERRYSGLPALEKAKEVVIEDDVFIGARTIVLKGSRIGSGSVIGAGSVVAGDIPKNSIAAGNPCRVVRQLY
jgi:acetyltransferase-like isoleucine patch superfamily enzyme